MPGKEFDRKVWRVRSRFVCRTTGNCPKKNATDAVASVGMVEHVGREKLPVYFRKAMRLLKPGGLFLNHGIGLGPVVMPGDTGSFIHDHVFPDTELISIGDMLTVAGNAGWGIRDVENLREHYALTLRHWISRLESHHEQALRFVDEPTYRVWRLYMAGCAHNFQVGRLCAYQTLLAKLMENGDSRAPAQSDPGGTGKVVSAIQLFQFYFCR